MTSVDLHTHSTASDGTFRPAEVMRAAKEAGLSAVALTDHDTIDGVAEAAAAAEAVGIEFLPGIEVSTAHPRPGTMHLLGFGFDPHRPAMLRLTTLLRDARNDRAEMIVRRLACVGIELSLDDVLAEGGTRRPHFAASLLRRGFATSIRDAFNRFLGGGGSAYVENNPLGSHQVIPLIRAAGGIVSLAHPFQLRRENFKQLEAMVRELAEQGMQALETLHGSHTIEQVHALTRLADRLSLIPTGGSDFHGAAKPWIRIGEAGNRRPVPRVLYDDLLSELGRSRGAETVAA